MIRGPRVRGALWVTASVALAAFASALVMGVAPRLALAEPLPDDDGEDDEHADASAPPPSAPKPDSGAPQRAEPAKPAPPTRSQVPGMVFIAGARYAMGAAASDKTCAPNERPSHMETVAPFYLDKTEVTVAAYRACVASHACTAPAKTSVSCTYAHGDPELPVSCVPWSSADAYCKSVGKRLPREAEWELAARGPQGFSHPWGNAPGGCNFAATLLHESTGKSCTGSHPSRVGQRLSGQSPDGALDLSGNVEEWVSDFYVEHIAEGAAPRAGASHVLRGGGWLSPPSMARATSRNWGSALEAGPNVGFRCAKDAR